jgi:hypothetical protein
VPWYRRLWKWALDHPEGSAGLASAVAGLAAVVVAAISVFVAVRSLDVASQALKDQTASDRMNRDLQTRSFASKVSLWGETTAISGPAATTPDTFHVQNLNNAPLGAVWLITGVHANVQFHNDGLAFSNTLSWQYAYTLGKMAPCSTMAVDYRKYGRTRNDVSLVFIDDNDLEWYQEPSGVLVQLQLSPSKLKQFLPELFHAPWFPRNRIVSQLLTGCS